MKKNQNKEVLKKKKWNKSDFSTYFKESRELSDYSCAKSGIVKSKYNTTFLFKFYY